MKVKLSDSWKVVVKTMRNGELSGDVVHIKEDLVNLTNNPCYIDPVSHFHIFVVDQGVSVRVNRTVSYLIDAGDMYIEQLRRFTPKIDEDTGDVSIVMSNVLVYTAYDKKFTYKSRSSKDINDLFSKSESFQCPGFESRQWKAKLCRSIQHINTNLVWHLCQGVDGRMFLFK